MSDLGRMISIVAQAFEGDTDKGGKPYVLHCLHVMNAVRHLGPKAMMIAVGHDLLEDKPEWTEQRLLDEGFEPSVVSGMVLMTHLPHETYEEYVEILAQVSMLRKIKREDLKHNSDPTRMKGLRQKDFERLEKYFRTYKYLKELDRQEAT